MVSYMSRALGGLSLLTPRNSLHSRYPYQHLSCFLHCQMESPPHQWSYIIPDLWICPTWTIPYHWWTWRIYYWWDNWLLPPQPRLAIPCLMAQIPTRTHWVAPYYRHPRLQSTWCIVSDRRWWAWHLVAFPQGFEIIFPHNAPILVYWCRILSSFILNSSSIYLFLF